MVSVNWNKCGDHWCDLERLTLNMNTGGVYIIWHDGNPSRVVRVGQGNIADRLGAHRNDPQVLKYGKIGTLRVTWAAVSVAQRSGVERHLANQWSPLVGDAFPDVQPIAVNSPF